MSAVYELLPPYAVESPEWHAQRRNGVGASDAAAVLGLSPWQTPFGIYEQKMGVPHNINPDLAYFGHALEPVIAGWVADTHPEVGEIMPGLSARSKAWPWLTAAPDRLAFNNIGTVGVELKSSSGFARQAWDGGIPIWYQVQVQQQCAVLGTGYGWLAVLHGGNSPELYRVERDDEFIDTVLVPQTRSFWEEHVLAKVAPEPSTTAEAVAIWPGDTDAEPVEADDDLYAAWQALQAARDARRRSDADLTRLEIQIMRALGDATELRRDGQVLATWKPRAGAKRLDGKQLRADHPDLADAYTVTGEATRVFVPKSMKEKVA